MVNVASGDHLLSVLDTVVDLSPVPHLSSCLDDTAGESVVHSHDIAGNESSPLFCIRLLKILSGEVPTLCCMVAMLRAGQAPKCGRCGRQRGTRKSVLMDGPTDVADY